MRAVLLVALVACAHSPAGELRFRDEAPVWRVNDRVALASAPAERIYNRALYHTDGFFVRRAVRALEVRAARRAADVNSLDEVPDSTWFTNRIGVRDLSLDEIRKGPNTDSPFDHRPWTITKAKSGGLSLGYIFEDARGVKYILKFDEADEPELETAAHAIVHRILWASGYNVPEDFIGYVRREDLVLGDKAKQRGYTEAALDRALGKVSRTGDGRIRVLASRYLPGKPIGPYAREGVRRDDPNDVIPHERRRSLRGQYAIFAWLNHNDIQEDNTLDMFEDGHVVHYLIDFGGALGTSGKGRDVTTVGHTYRLDIGIALRSFLTFGLLARPWEDITTPGLRGVGLFEARSYDPGAWRANSIYFPYEDKDRHDAFWGAKIAMRFSREQLAAAVGEGQLSDPRASAYLLETLVERQRKTARYWFDRVAPLDHFRMHDDRLCFTDLTLSYRLRDVATRYEIDAYDKAGAPTGYRRSIRAMSDGRTCATGLYVDDYTIVRIRVYRNAHAMPAVRVHVTRNGVVGLRRD